MAALKEAGNHLISIVGAKNKDLLIMTDEVNAVSDRLELCTDDGSYGFHGFVTDRMKKMIDEEKVKIDMILAVGPAIMMRAVANLTRPYGIKTIVSLNPIMVDGTGMCGMCRVKVGDEIKFACVDGPEFDGHLVDFDELLKRQRMFIEQEKRAYDRYLSEKDECKCEEGKR
jgi:ferredoxin--NADP+ reductase